MGRTTTMPRKKIADRDRLDLRIEPDLAKRATKRAAELGINISSYIRMLIATDLERVDRERRLAQGPK